MMCMTKLWAQTAKGNFPLPNNFIIHKHACDEDGRGEKGPHLPEASFRCLFMPRQSGQGIFRPASPDALSRKRTLSPSCSNGSNCLIFLQQSASAPPHSPGYSRHCGFQTSYAGMKSKEIFIATWEENKEREESGHQNTDEGFSESQSEFHDFFNWP